MFERRILSRQRARLPYDRSGTYKTGSQSTDYLVRYGMAVLIFSIEHMISSKYFSTRRETLCDRLKV